MVGIVDVASWMPQRWMSAEEIGEASGIPTEIITDRFGLDGKHVAGPDDHVSTMGVAAARRLLEATRTDPSAIDVVAYFGSMWKDYNVWSASPKIQAELGCHNAWAFEMAYVSCGTPVAVRVLSDMIAADPEVRTVLAVGACREAHLLDYGNERSRFMFNFGDGAAAMLLSADRGHRVASHAIRTDGRFADFVAVFGGGSRRPAFGGTAGRAQHYLDVSDPAAMKEGLDPVSGPNFVAVANEACAKADITPSDLALVAPIHFKRSFFSWIMSELGLGEERGVYLRSHGHMSGIDPLVGLDLSRSRLAEGDYVLLLAAGTGYTWAATVIEW
jgi:3-oxoacyl-[acyl-carrier-protein] synthase-3